MLEDVDMAKKMIAACFVFWRQPDKSCVCGLKHAGRRSDSVRVPLAPVYCALAPKHSQTFCVSLRLARSIPSAPGAALHRPHRTARRQGRQASKAGG